MNRKLFVFMICILTIVISIIFCSYLTNSSFTARATQNAEPDWIAADELNFSAVSQFPVAENTQSENRITWSHMPISYSIEKTCGQSRIKKIKSAINEISAATDGAIIFIEISQNADIKINCTSLIKKEANRRKAAQTSATIRGNVIQSAQILSYPSLGSCNIPMTETHELLHAFGFSHSVDKSSVMYELAVNCKQLSDKKEQTGTYIDSDIISKLKSTYYG